jgi:asparagine synthase (glutamine-hydrolysing)
VCGVHGIFDFSGAPVDVRLLILVHAYAEHGESFVDHLNGMSSFALWDARRPSLLIGRDRLGIEPIYYLNDGRRS